MAHLKQATWPVHQRLEKRLAVKDRFADLDLYRAHLARLLAFHEAAEAAWAPWLVPVLEDFAVRRKAQLLRHDLAALGGQPGREPPALPAVHSSAAALGGFYVLEGATLGGQHLLPLVARHLGLSRAHGASYLASYGADVAPMWQRFGAAVQRHCHGPAAAQAVATAQATFAMLEDCLCGDTRAHP